MSETPPRTWRRLISHLSLLVRCGNTSTDVEKTSLGGSVPVVGGKHLHGRGEDKQTNCGKWLAPETPPRTWRRRACKEPTLLWLRNTSTDVEKTEVSFSHVVSLWKHLHGRGEDSLLIATLARLRETPPRTWRRRPRSKPPPDPQGNTSTDVEKTKERPQQCGLFQKHLHGRGEDRTTTASRRQLLETPPRTWRRRFLKSTKRYFPRNTSTDVEKTGSMSHARAPP